MRDGERDTGTVRCMDEMRSRLEKENVMAGEGGMQLGCF